MPDAAPLDVPAFTISNLKDREIKIFADGRVEGLIGWEGPVIINNRIPQIIATARSEVKARTDTAN